MKTPVNLKYRPYECNTDRRYDAKFDANMIVKYNLFPYLRMSEPFYECRLKTLEPVILKYLTRRFAA